jgi:hypothetical protein
MISKNF